MSDMTLRFITIAVIWAALILLMLWYPDDVQMFPRAVLEGRA